MAERRHPSRAGVEPVRSSATATCELVHHLVAGGELLDEPPTTGSLRRLAAVLGPAEEADEAARAGTSAAVAAARRDPVGADALWGGAWDAVGFAGTALLAMLEAIGRPTRLGTDRLRGVTLQEQVLLLLVEVELIPPDEVAGFLDAPLTEVHDHLRRLQLGFQLPPPPASPCATWDEVRSHHRLEGDARDDAESHLDACDPCAEAHEVLVQRRDDLVRNLPGIGWTHLGQAFAALD